jgi:hypothetical protein
MNPDTINSLLKVFRDLGFSCRVEGDGHRYYLTLNRVAIRSPTEADSIVQLVSTSTEQKYTDRLFFDYRCGKTNLDVNLDWNNCAIRKIAQGIKIERRVEDLPVLGDALEDAGCTDRAVLEHCRLPPYYLDSWVLDAITNPLYEYHVPGLVDFCRVNRYSKYTHQAKALFLCKYGYNMSEDNLRKQIDLNKEQFDLRWDLLYLPRCEWIALEDENMSLVEARDNNKRIQLIARLIVTTRTNPTCRTPLESCAWCLGSRRCRFCPVPSEECFNPLHAIVTWPSIRHCDLCVGTRRCVYCK